MDRKRREWKRIAIRFLKETGYYSPFKEYVRTYKITPENIFCVECIDEIFMGMYFTYYLRHHKRINIRSSICKHFRNYVRLIYGEYFYPILITDEYPSNYDFIFDDATKKYTILKDD